MDALGDGNFVNQDKSMKMDVPGDGNFVDQDKSIKKEVRPRRWELC
jgi:hypothetical protein